MCFHVTQVFCDCKLNCMCLPCAFSSFILCPYHLDCSQKQQDRLDHLWHGNICYLSWLFTQIYILCQILNYMYSNFVKVMMGLVTAGASAATAIVYLAHYGNSSTNWFAFCRQFNSFCGRISGSLIGSFVAITVLVLLIIMQSVAISRRWCVARNCWLVLMSSFRVNTLPGFVSVWYEKICS